MKTNVSIYTPRWRLKIERCIIVVKAGDIVKFLFSVTSVKSGIQPQHFYLIHQPQARILMLMMCHWITMIRHCALCEWWFAKPWWPRGECISLITLHSTITHAVMLSIMSFVTRVMQNYGNLWHCIMFSHCAPVLYVNHTLYLFTLCDRFEQKHCAIASRLHIY